MGLGAILERLRMSFYNNPSEDREFQAVRQAMVLPSVALASGRPAPPTPTQTRETPPPPLPPETVPQDTRENEPTDGVVPDRERAIAATHAVEGVEDATIYGLTIPFLRWLIAYKAGLTAEDFAISSKEDLAETEQEHESRPHDSEPDRHAAASAADVEPNRQETTVRPEVGMDTDDGEDDVLSIPESKEIGDDQAEREALIGQFGARTQTRDTYYPNLASFVELHVANMWPYQQGVMTKFLWVPDWWKHPPLIYQLDALWRAYENARRQPGQMMIFNIQAFGLLDRVFNKDTGLVASLGIDENEHTTGPGEPLPCVRPPKGWRRKAMEPLRPVRPKEMDETMPSMETERTIRRMPPRRVGVRMRNETQQEGDR